MEKTEVVAKIIEYVGGKDNVVNTWHCMTRLRFELKDTSKIQEDAIKALDGVIGVQFAKGQLQIVLGTSVHKYYDIALQMLDLKEDIAAPAQPEKKKDFISWFMDMVSGVFGPIVPAIAGAGMIKGLMGGLVALGVVSNATDTYKIIDMLASGVFTFLPFFIAASAAKKFKTNQYLAIAIAATLMYPPWWMLPRRRDQQLYVCRHPAHSGIQLFWFGHSHHLRRICPELYLQVGR